MFGVAASLVAFLWWGAPAPTVPTGPTVAIHYAPNVWFLHLRVFGDSISTAFVDPRGRVCSVEHPGTPGKAIGREIPFCDYMAFGMAPRGDRPGWKTAQLSTWRPVRGVYRIRVRGVGHTRVDIEGASTLGEDAYSSPRDSLTMERGEERVWLARWIKLSGEEGFRLDLERCPSPQDRASKL